MTAPVKVYVVFDGNHFDDGWPALRSVHATNTGAKRAAEQAAGQGQDGATRFWIQVGPDSEELVEHRRYEYLMSGEVDIGQRFRYVIFEVRMCLVAE